MRSNRRTCLRKREANLPEQQREREGGRMRSRGARGFERQIKGAVREVAFLSAKRNARDYQSLSR